ncbi:hypothetical protein DFQ27_002982 [Actinomortierella ambigua]|uniref:Uncharacterized protein n=1 Tax=Actinomortierella ambigua TaxID=1343610 RepID=A0A9P6Q755_9FUNG|nr:hypothetical protein DFQ26_002089 [Actinomortierella ambigua]KAG0261397.1 hypothetical protein DFQ27_002982 [Actinomortierella ambigua]
MAGLPPPVELFSSFKRLCLSLPAYDWFNFVESWNSMLQANAPWHEFSQNLQPYIAKELIVEFQRLFEAAEHDSDAMNTLTTVMMSTLLLIKVEAILPSESVFLRYIDALKLDAPSASHSEVMQSLQTFLSSLPETTRLQVQKIFADEEASDALGLSSYTLDTALHLLHQDTQLYIDILHTLQLNQTQNLAWDVVVDKIKSLVMARKPHAWPGIDQFLQSLHWGYYQDAYYEYAEYEDELVDGDDYNRHYDAFLSDVSDRQDEARVISKFGDLGVTDKRAQVEIC